MSAYLSELSEYPNECTSFHNKILSMQSWINKKFTDSLKYTRIGIEAPSPFDEFAKLKRPALSGVYHKNRPTLISRLFSQQLPRQAGL